VIQKTGSTWAVKGRGHNFNPGFASSSGVQISLASLNSISYDPATELASYGPGNAFSDVYPKLEEFGRIAIGGRVQGVGVAGLSTGGGIGYKSNQHGLACDNTVQYELVTYTGEILNVTEKSYPDLFFGLQVRCFNQLI
jgi:FAD/FMN-containing dehydrogenase